VPRNSPFAGSCSRPRRQTAAKRVSSPATAASISVLAAADAWRWSARFRDRGRPIPRHGTTAHDPRGLALVINTLAIFTAGVAEGRGATCHAAPLRHLRHARCRASASHSSIPVRQGDFPQRQRSLPASEQPSRCRRPRSIPHSPRGFPRFSSTRFQRGRAMRPVIRCRSRAARPRRNLSVINIKLTPSRTLERLRPRGLHYCRRSVPESIAKPIARCGGIGIGHGNCQ